MIIARECVTFWFIFSVILCRIDGTVADAAVAAATFVFACFKC